MHQRRLVLAGLLISATFGVATSPVQAAATNAVAAWSMNESPGASTMTDSSGNGLNGSVGSAVVTGRVANGVVFYHWDSDSALYQPPAKPERVVRVPDDASGRLDPGKADFAATVRFRTKQGHNNIFQKGQTGNVGGFWKVEMPSAGVVSCLFRGADGNKAVNSGVGLNDGQWHTIRCERSADRVVMTVDGGNIVRRGFGPTGLINNNKPLAIGGKSSCDQVNTMCDYFVGDIDYVTIERG